jgi:hypothetical protein
LTREPEAIMQTYQGGCHCGRVRFEITTDFDKVVECNCSICTKKGAIHHRVPPDRFRLLAGQDSLALYQSGTKVAKHWFCKNCGIHPFSNPRAAPELYSINLRCLDDFHALAKRLVIKKFDGQNWEEAIKNYQQL